MIPNSVTKLACCAVATPFLVACAAIPKVVYTKIGNTADPAQQMVDAAGAQAIGISDSFYLAQSQIIIDKGSDSSEAASATNKKDDKEKHANRLAAKTSEDNKEIKDDQPTPRTTAVISVTSKPTEYKAFKVGFRPYDSVRVTTNVNIVKQDNTDLVASIGVETTDNTKTMIDQIGGAIAKVIPLVVTAGFSAQPKSCSLDEKGLPISLTLDGATLARVGAKVSHLTFDENGKIVGDGEGCIVVTLGEKPVDAIATSSMKFEVETSNYYYSACRDATVKVTTAGPSTASTKVRIADPNFVQFVKLPYKGSITMHSQCGVSVKTEKGGTDVTGAQIVDALATQGKAIKDALNASNKK